MHTRANRFRAGYSPRAMERTRDRRALIAAIALSSFGDELAIVALALRVNFLSGRSPGAVALLFVAAALPHVLFAPLSGWLTDRRETVQTLRWCSLAAALVATLLAFASTVPVVIALAFVLGSVASVTGPSVFALVPLLGEDDVSRTNSSIEIAKYAGWISGPFVAGLVASRNTAAPLMIDALTFVVLALVTFGITVRRPPVPAEQLSKDEGARAGFAYIVKDRLLLLVFAVILGVVLFAATDNVAEVFFAADTLHEPAIGYGVLASGWMVGMVVGAILARRVVAERAPAWIAGGAVVGGLAVVAAAASGMLLPAAVLFGVGGIANGLENVSARTLVHGRVPTELHGRVFAAYMGLVSGTQIVSTMFGGVLVGVVGGQEALVVGGLGTAVFGILGLFGLALAPARQTAPRVADDATERWY